MHQVSCPTADRAAVGGKGHPNDPGEAAGDSPPASLRAEQLLRPPSEDRDVLTYEGDDAFEGPVIGVEVPEEAGHGGGVGGLVTGFQCADRAKVFLQSCPPTPPEHAIPLTQQRGLRLSTGSEKADRESPYGGLGRASCLPPFCTSPRTTRTGQTPHWTVDEIPPLEEQKN